MPLQLVLALRPLGCDTPVLPAAQWPDLPARAADLLIVDGDGLDGAALLRAIRAHPAHGHIPVLLVASGEARALRRVAVEAGATDVLVRPVDPLDLQIRARTLIDLTRARLAADKTASLMDRHVAGIRAESESREREIIQRLMLAAEFRDDQAGDHLTRVAGCAIAIAEGLGLSEAAANDIALASTMHDIGKIGIPDSILLKAGPLTDGEREEMKRHAERGYRMLHDSPSRLLQLASEIALTHHERWDGTGYPRGLCSADIPLCGRIIAVADVFDALISERVYKAAWPLEKARAYLVEHRGSHFDPACVDAFLSRWDDIVGLMRDRPAGAGLA
ncbi:HD-GYP domain-containing protein [Methylobacterium segetis]|uniref:HD-GYP domain-containing protein n=1 Tax=Methylobacterium segetis TaxID=2488750 RepID=UPI0010430D55|nr:HD domain-containing phosphohydrolase [Methylobacterium segetis]